MQEEKSCKEQLLSKLLEGVKGCQSRFGSRTELATEDDLSVRRLCLAFENVFLHGAKGQPQSSKGLWQMTENLVTSGLRLNTEPLSFWSLIKSQLSKHDAERFLLLQYVRSDFGRSRAWLRAALNEHSLERYILIILSLDSLNSYYEPWAFFRDPELSAILPQTAAGLGSVLFALVVDNPVLDSPNRDTGQEAGSSVASPVEVAEVADQFLAATKQSSTLNAISPVSGSEGCRDDKKGLRKKKKKPVNVVSFDDDEEESKRESPRMSSSSCSEGKVTESPKPSLPVTSPKISLPVSGKASEDTEYVNSIEKSCNSTNSSSNTKAIPVTVTDNDKQHTAPQLDFSFYSSSVKSADCISVNSVYSDCSERFDIESSNMPGLEISPSQRLKPVRNDRGISDDCDNNSEYPFDSSSQDLIPVPNFDSCVAPELLDLPINLETASIQSLGVVSPATPSCSSEATLPTIVGHQAATDDNSQDSKKTSTLELNKGINSKSKDASETASTTNRSESVSTYDTDNNAENDTIHKLKVILDREVETVAMLRAHCAEEKRRTTDQMKILEAKVESLTKENEILKHQLKKYVGAVQMLKKDSGSVRRKSSFDLDSDITDSNIPCTEDSSDDAAEYERKLIQVAEMHGELMEFNAHLQKCLQKREGIIRRLREELVDLRGPLAAAPFVRGEDNEADAEFDSWDIVDSMSSADSQNRASAARRITSGFGNERILINIWIPSAFLTGSANDLHHVYQVFIRIKDTEWNVYRRYSQFYSLHRDMKKKDSVVGTFYFPPKKHLGNKDTRFVDDRRRKLQEYLRKVINHTLETNSILAAHPDKKLLVSILPFFGESNSSHQNLQKPHRERSRSRALFFLNSGSGNRDQSASGFTTQANSSQYPQYTGL